MMTEMTRNLKNMKKLSLLKSGLMSVALAGASLSAQANVEMTFTWSGSLWQSGYTADNYAPGSPQHLIAGDDAIGIYAFNTSGTDGVASTLYSVCLSPAGLLDENPHSYVVESFAAANPGIFPAAWASGTVQGVLQYWGIENAAYLWNTFGMNIVNGTGGQAGNSDARGAALEFAIWTALYDSKGYGALGGNVWTAPTSQMDASTTLAYYDQYLNALTSAGGNIPLYSGNILEGTSAPGDGPLGGDDQEFLVLGAAVPEPGTLISGALLLLPFGVAAFRLYRKPSRA
jgi:hypothetical protein